MSLPRLSAVLLCAVPLLFLPLSGLAQDQAGAAKKEATKADATKTDSAKTDAAKTDAARTDAARGAVAKTDTATERKDDPWVLERLFSRRGFMGPSATGMAFSHDGKHAAYLWKPYADRLDGNDLWLLDVATGKSEKVTSLDMMAKFQASARAAKEAKEKRAAGGAAAASAGGEGQGRGGEGRFGGRRRTEGQGEQRQQDGEKKDDQKKDEQKKEEEQDDAAAAAARGGRYAGISSFVWSPREHELLFISEGDIYRWKLGMKAPIRLTLTRNAESGLQYLPDGSGFLYMRDGALMRWRFGRDREEQLDPRLAASAPPTGFGEGRGQGRRQREEQRDQQQQQQDGAEGQTAEGMTGFRLSPDGKRLVLMSRKRLPAESKDAQGRKVNIASYRDRFMTVREVPREVTEDPTPNYETNLYLYEIGDPFQENGVLSPVFTFKSVTPRDQIGMPDWSGDSKRVAFMTYQHNGREVQIHEAVVADKPEKDKAAAAKLLTKFQHNGGPTTPGMIQPRYLDDHKRLCFLTEQSGFRHLHLLDPAYEAMEQLTSGRYEVYPIGMSKDRACCWFAATKEHPSCRDIYRYRFADRTLMRVTKECGSYDNVVVSPDERTLLASYVCFGQPRELHLVDLSGAQKAVTSSHPETAKALTAEKPEFFTYLNRHGQEIHGYLFKPEGWKKTDKRPLLIYVYGGPLGTSKNVVQGSYQSDGYHFAAYMAKKHGYLTCTIDPRGMSGYGAVFEKANYEQVGKPQVEDLTDGVKHLIANYGVDPKRVGIHGWSFGGFQTQMCMYTAPDVFAVGMAGAGPTEWENYNSWYSSGTIGPKDLGKFSLLPLAKNLKGKLLLVHGMEDSNVLYQDTVRVYRELLKAGKATNVELFLDPTGGHGLGGDVDRLQKAKKYEDFLLRTLGRYEQPQLAEKKADDKPAADAAKATSQHQEDRIRLLQKQVDQLLAETKKAGGGERKQKDKE